MVTRSASDLEAESNPDGGASPSGDGSDSTAESPSPGTDDPATADPGTEAQGVQTRGPVVQWLGPEAWDEAVAASPDATGHHLRPWCEALAAARGPLECGALSVRLADGEHAVLPLLLRRRAILRSRILRAYAGLRGTYGGPIAPRPLDEDDWRRVLWACAKARIHNLVCGGNLLAPIPRALREHVRIERASTHLLELDGCEGELREGFTTRGRRGLRAAESAGVRCGRLRGSDAIWSFLELFREARRGPSARTEAGFDVEAIAKLISTDAAELWGAFAPEGNGRAGSRTEGSFANGTLAAGALVLYGRDHATLAQGVRRKSLSHLQPSHLLYERALTSAQSRGCRVFDFGPSGGHAGLEAFKSLFGASRVEFDRWRVRPRALRNPRGGS